MGLGYAIQRPFTDWKKTLIGTILLAIPYVNIITGFFVHGYSMRCAATARKQQPMPSWGEWGTLFVNGLLAAVISLIYFLPAIIVGMAVAGASFTAMLQGEVSSGFFSGAGVIAAVLGVLAMYVLPGAVARFAVRGNFGAAFQFRDVLERAFSGDYFITWLLFVVYAAVVGMLGGIVAGFLAVTIILPFLVLGFVNFIIGVAAMTAFGELVQK